MNSTEVAAALARQKSEQLAVYWTGLAQLAEDTLNDRQRDPAARRVAKVAQELRIDADTIDADLALLRAHVDPLEVERLVSDAEIEARALLTEAAGLESAAAAAEAQVREQRQQAEALRCRANAARSGATAAARMQLDIERRLADRGHPGCMQTRDDARKLEAVRSAQASVEAARRDLELATSEHAKLCADPRRTTAGVPGTARGVEDARRVLAGAERRLRALMDEQEPKATVA